MILTNRGFGSRKPSIQKGSGKPRTQVLFADSSEPVPGAPPELKPAEADATATSAAKKIDHTAAAARALPDRTKLYDRKFFL